MHDECTMPRAWPLKGAARLIHPRLAEATPRCSGIRCARSPGGFGVTVSIPWRPPKKPAWTFLIQSMLQSGASSSYRTPGVPRSGVHPSYIHPPTLSSSSRCDLEGGSGVRRAETPNPASKDLLACKTGLVRSWTQARWWGGGWRVLPDS